MSKPPRNEAPGWQRCPICFPKKKGLGRGISTPTLCKSDSPPYRKASLRKLACDKCGYRWSVRVVEEVFPWNADTMDPIDFQDVGDLSTR